MRKTFKIMILLLGLVTASSLGSFSIFIPNIVETVQASPDTYDSRATSFTFSTGVIVLFPLRAYDNSNTTYSGWYYTRGYPECGTSDGYFELNMYGPKVGSPRGSRITRVDLKVSYYVVSQASTDATLKLSYLVSPSATETTLRGPIRETAGWYNLTYNNQADPNGGGWSWEDVTDLKFRFTRADPSTADTGGEMRIHEVWTTVHYEFSQVVAIYPKVQSPIPSSVKINVTGIEELYGFEFKMTYNTTAITVTGFTLGPFLNTTAGGTANTYSYKVKLDDAAGIVWATQSITGDRRGGSVAVGSWATLATINIATDAGGPTNLNFEVKLAGHNYVLKKTYPIAFTLIQPGHDLAVTNVNAVPTTVTRGDLVNIDVTVKNEGDYIETFTVTIYAAGNEIVTKTVSSLGLGATTVVSHSWDTRPHPASNYLITAQAKTQAGITDVDSADNTGTGPTVIVNPLFGDIDQDGWVSVSDLVLLQQAFGCTPSDPNYTLDKDLNTDSIIDVRDLRLLGRAWEPPPP